MRSITLIESQSKTLSLTQSEAQALRTVGMDLASSETWWGSNDEALGARSVISCEPIDATTWRVLARDVVGLVVVSETLQLIVNPKIPIGHFVYLAQLSGAMPRLHDSPGMARAATSWWELVASWFTSAGEALMRRDLSRDYHDVADELSALRGRLLPEETANAYYAGRSALACEFDEFDVDMPLNRVLRAAACVVAGSRVLQLKLRRRAERLRARMDGVSELRRPDLLASTDRQTAHYRDGVLLARHILTSVGRGLEIGPERVWAFLFRTPPLIEEGVRRLLQQTPTGDCVRKRGMRLPNSTLTLNPDLVIERKGSAVAVADVKYKLATGDWKRGDLYQTVTFASGFRVWRAAICDFVPSGVARLATLQVGDVQVTHLRWLADPEIPPDAAADQCQLEFGQWLAFGPVETAATV